MDFNECGVNLRLFVKPNPMVRSLYKSADMKNEMTITLDPVVGFGCAKGQFGVVFRSEGSQEPALSFPLGHF